MRIARTRSIAGTAAGAACIVAGSVLILSGCGSEQHVAVPRVGTPVRETRAKVPPAPPATRAPGDNCYDESYEMHGNPTAQEQLILELLNRARLDPDAEAVRLDVHWVIDPDGAGPVNIGDVDINENEAALSLNIQPLHPLAMNGRLLEAARLHCWDMNDRSFFDHVNPDGHGPDWRITDQGYIWTTYGENIAVGQPSPEAHHEAYIVDDYPNTDGRGHRLNCLDAPGLVEVGIGYIDPAIGASNRYSTEDFGRRAGYDAFIVGVVYDDADSDGFYDIDEGIADVTVMPDSGDWHAITSDSGGYAIPLTTSGNVTITFQFPGAYGTAVAAKPINVDNPLARKVDCTLQESDAYGHIEFSSATYQENEDVGGGVATVTVSRTGGDFGDVGVTFETTSGGTATVVDDYAATSGPLSWGDGDSADKTFTVAIVDDNNDEPNETVALALNTPTGGADLGAQSTATLTILDEDVAGVLSITTTPLTVGEEDGSITIEISRTGGSDGAVDVNYATGGGSASVASDYTATSGTFHWAHGVTTPQTFDVPIVNLDTTPEPDETFNITLSAATNGATIGAPNPAVVTITDDDQPGTISFVATSYSVAEGDAGTATVTLQATRTGGWRGDAELTYSTADGTADSPADFVEVVGGTVLWTDGQDGPKDIDITVEGDLALEIDEEFTVTLTGVTSPTGASLGSPTTATVTILDNETDSAPPGLVIATPQPGDVLQGVTVISGTATDNLAVGSVQICIDGGPWITVPGVPVADSVDWQYALATWDIPNGTHDVTVLVTDYRGSPTQTTVTVTVENEIGILGANGIGGCLPGGGPFAWHGTLAVALALLALLAGLRLRRRRQ